MNHQQTIKKTENPLLTTVIKNQLQDLLTILKSNNLTEIRKSSQTDKNTLFSEIIIRIYSSTPTNKYLTLYIVYFMPLSHKQGRNSSLAIPSSLSLQKNQTFPIFGQFTKRKFDENANEAQLLTDLNFKIIAYNLKFKNRFYYYFNTKILMDKNLRTYLENESIERLEQARLTVLNGNTFSYSINVKPNRKNINQVYFQFDPVKNKRGEITSILLSGINVSEQNRILKEKEILEETNQALLDIIPFPVWIYDPLTREILDVNTNAINTYRVDKNTFLTKANLNPNLEKQLIASNKVDLVNPLEISTHLGIFTSKTGDEKWIRSDVHFTKIIYLNRTCYLVSENDITETELRFKISQLENELLEEALQQDANIEEALNKYLGGLWWVL